MQMFPTPQELPSLIKGLQGAQCPYENTSRRLWCINQVFDALVASDSKFGLYARANIDLTEWQYIRYIPVAHFVRINVVSTDNMQSTCMYKKLESVR